MDIVCKEKYNVIFWRNSPSEEWNCEDLDVVINAYEEDPYCDLEYWTTVHPVGNEEKDLYYLFTCDHCKQTVAALDREHGYKYCPYCGSAIWSE